MTIRIRLSLSIFVLLSCTTLIGQNIGIDFYGEHLEFRYSQQLVLPERQDYRYISESDILSTNELQRASINREVFFVQLDDYATKFKLNDWLLYGLTLKLANAIFKEELDRTIFIYSYLFSRDIAVRIGYTKRFSFVEVLSSDQIYELPVGECNRRNKCWLRLPSQSSSSTYYGRFYTCKAKELRAYTKGRCFSFKISVIPNLPNSEILSKEVSFSTGDIDLTCSVLFNKTYMRILEDFPLLGLEEYLLMPNYKPSIDAIVSSLDSILSTNRRTRLRQLLSVSRSIGIYNKDTEIFGKSERPQIFDELLFRQEGDCEDFSLLLVALLKEFFPNESIILIRYDSHVNVGISLDGVSGAPNELVKYKGKSYIVLEPTEMSDTRGIGYGKEDGNFEIIPCL